MKSLSLAIFMLALGLLLPTGPARALSAGDLSDLRQEVPDNRRLIQPVDATLDLSDPVFNAWMNGCLRGMRSSNPQNNLATNRANCLRLISNQLSGS